MQECENLIEHDRQAIFSDINKKLINARIAKISKLYSVYNLLVSREALLIKRIAGDDNSVEKYFAIYCCLLKNGVLSKDNKFNYGLDDKEMIFKFPGVSVSMGKGLCRNIAVNFIDILKELRPDIKIFPVGTKLPHPLDKDKTTNHLEVLILSKKGELYLYDPTNFRINRLNFVNKSFDKNFYDIRYSLIFGELDFKESLEQKVESLEKGIRILYRATATPTPKEQIIQIHKYGIDRCLAGINEVKLFLNGNRELFEEVSRERDKMLIKN